MAQPIQQKTARFAKRRFSIRMRLILIVLVVLTPTAIVMWFSANAHRELLIEKAGDQLATTAHLHAKAQDHLVDRTEMLLRAVRYTDPIQGNDGAVCAALLHNLVADVGFLNGMGVSYTNGDKFCSTNAKSKVNLADRPFFKKALTGETAVGPMVIARTNGKAILPVAVPAFGDDGQPVRVISTGIPMDSIGALVQAADLPDGRMLTITDAKGVVLVSTDPALKFGDPAPWGVLAGSGKARWEDQLLGLATAHSGDVVIVVSQPEAELLAASDRIFHNDLTAFAAVAAIALLLAFAMGEVVFTRRLARLAHVASSLAGGRLSARVNLPGGGDEIGDLATAVDLMAGSIEAHIIDLAEREAAARHDATHDALTGLPNRPALKSYLAETLAAMTGTEDSAAVLYIDLDQFKEINDTHGHTAGDHLLTACARRLSDCIGAAGMVARLGGDEFAVVLPCSDTAQAQAMSDRIIACLVEPFRLEEHDARIGASIGIAMIPRDGVDPLRLMQKADIALFAAKMEGRNLCRFFEPRMEERMKRRRQIEDALRTALQGNQFEVHYQPLVAATDTSMLGVEALLRWRHPELGNVSPGEFIPVAEETGMIVQIGAWVLETACHAATQWPDITLSVNVSPVQFKQAGLIATVQQALAKSGLPAERLELEITEGVLVQNTEEAVRVLEELKALGVRIAMDDFGTGYSSLGYLQLFPFDKLKVDKCFVDGLGITEDSDAIVASVITLGHSLGMCICAEGVERPEQHALLEAMGCDVLQGYLFGRPGPRKGIDEALGIRAEGVLAGV